MLNAGVLYPETGAPSAHDLWKSTFNLKYRMLLCQTVRNETRRITSGSEYEFRLMGKAHRLSASRAGDNNNNEISLVSTLVEFQINVLEPDLQQENICSMVMLSMSQS